MSHAFGCCVASVRVNLEGHIGLNAGALNQLGQAGDSERGEPQPSTFTNGADRPPDGLSLAKNSRMAWHSAPNISRYA
jgi:hypothetical protein